MVKYSYNDKSYNVAIVGDAHIHSTPPRSRKDDYFQSIMNKIDGICAENDIVIFLGDLFNKPVMEVKYLYMTMNFFLEKKKQGCKIFSIVGNHDIYNYNEQTLEKTTLGILSWMGLVRIFDVLEVNGVTFHRLPLVAKINSVPEIMASPAILLAHCFYKSGADPDFSLTDGLIQESKYDMIVMGHDHEPYEDVLVGGTQVIRPGSLTRNTSHTYQLHRMPKYLRMEIALDSAFELSKCDIPNALLPKEVFDEAYFGNALDVSAAFLSNMDFLINSFSQPDRGKQLSIRKVLEDLAPPIQVMDYLRHLHSRLELDFI